MTWEPLKRSSKWNGIGLGYEVQYKSKSAGDGNWTSVLISGSSSSHLFANSLLKYRVYEFRVAGRTIKGSGLYSGIKEERTMEDGMYCKAELMLLTTLLYIHPQSIFFISI